MAAPLPRKQTRPAVEVAEKAAAAVAVAMSPSPSPTPRTAMFPFEIQVIGNVEAYSTITVKAQVGGQLVNVYFKEGDFVKQGAKLFDIDPRPLEAAYNQVIANIARDKAALLQAQANMARDEANAKYQDAQAKRYAELFQAGVISKDQAEQLRASADASAQAVAADQAAIASAQADIGASTATAENARVQLGFTTIYSPIDGRTGNLAVKQGNVVTANTSELMTINEVEPIYVTFSVPEAQLGDIKRYMARASSASARRPRMTTRRKSPATSLSSTTPSTPPPAPSS